MLFTFGRVPERSNGAVLKTVAVQAAGSSNLPPSAKDITSSDHGLVVGVTASTAQAMFCYVSLYVRATSEEGQI